MFGLIVTTILTCQKIKVGLKLISKKDFQLVVKAFPVFLFWLFLRQNNCRKIETNPKTMKRGSDLKSIIVKATGKEYSIHNVSDGGPLFDGAPRGTIIVENPLYNPEAAKQWLTFSPGEVEIVYKDKVDHSYFARQKKLQEESGAGSQER